MKSFYVPVLAVSIAIALLTACGGASGSANASNPANNGNSRAAISPTPDSTPADTTPVTIAASDIISEVKSSGWDQYRGRTMTITDGELWEIMYSHIKIGGRYGNYSEGYIICNGSFSDYTQYADKISDMQKAHKSPGASVKGVFSKVVTDMGYTQVHLDPCVLSDLEK
jgi:hypothetical protein